MPYKDKAKHRACQNAHYARNSAYYIKRAHDKRDAALNKIAELKSILRCAICSENDPATFDFHHLDPTEKEGLVNMMVRRGWSWRKVINELTKCVCLCSNCHRKVHAYENWAALIDKNHLIVVTEEYKTAPHLGVEIGS